MISGELIKIDGQSVPSLKSYSVSYEKVWSGGTRNMMGDHRATLLGTDVIIVAEFGGDLLVDDMTSLLPKLSEDYFEVTFYDPQSDTPQTGYYYVDGYEVELLSKHKGRYDTFSVEFKPVSRRN